MTKIGAIQFRMVPETLKGRINLGLDVPGIFIVPSYRFEQKETQQNQKKKAEIIEKDEQISQQEQIINQLKEKLQERTNYELRNKYALIDELQILNLQVLQMRDKLKELNEYYLTEIQPLETESLPILQSNREIIHLQYYMMFTINKRKSFQKYQELNLNKSKIWEKIQVQDCNQSKLLQMKPEACAIVQFTSEDKLTARYIVEDVNEIVSLDPQATVKLSFLKFVFRHMLICYDLLIAEQDKQLWEEVSVIFNKYETALRSQFDLLNKQQP